MSAKLAIHGGTPVRNSLLPYGRQDINADDIEAVSNVLASDWLTTGPTVAEFESAMLTHCATRFAVAVNSGTAALHSAAYAGGIGPGDEVIVPSITFISTASIVVHLGARPVFADVEADTLNIDVTKLGSLVTSKTRAIIPVDFAGQPCNYSALLPFAAKHSLLIIEDAAHSLGATFDNKPVGSLSPLTCFSLHPVKHITTGEGGVITTDNEEFAAKMKRFRNHGIDRDHRTRSESNSWEYYVEDIGFNYRLTDFQCALGLSQLSRLEHFVERRRSIAKRYDDILASISGVKPLVENEHARSSYHLYVVRLIDPTLCEQRKNIFEALRAEGIGVNVHYYPVHLQPFYQNRFGTQVGDCPIAEKSYPQLISLPIFPTMTESDCADVETALRKVINYFT